MITWLISSRAGSESPLSYQCKLCRMLLNGTDLKPCGQTNTWSRNQIGSTKRGLRRGARGKMHLLVKSHVTWSCFWYMKYMKNGYRMRDTTTRVRSTLNMPWEKNLLAWESWCRCHWEKRDNNLKLKQCGRSQLWLRGGKSPGDISGGSESFKFPILFLGI